MEYSRCRSQKGVRLWLSLCLFIRQTQRACLIAGLSQTRCNVPERPRSSVCAEPLQYLPRLGHISKFDADYPM